MRKPTPLLVALGQTAEAGWLSGEEREVPLLLGSATLSSGRVCSVLNHSWLPGTWEVVPAAPGTVLWSQQSEWKSRCPVRSPGHTPTGPRSPGCCAAPTSRVWELCV